MGREFKAPDFVADNSPEAVLTRMRDNLPSDIDSMPGSVAYDLVMPTAIEKSELINFYLVRTLMLMFPQYAWGEWLDLHGIQVGVKRHEPNRAAGFLTVEGQEGTEIPEGTIFCTPATDTSPAIEFYTEEAAEIGESGTVTLPITAREAGVRSNVGAGTIVLMMRPQKGITAVYNEAAVTGGTEGESDESLYERIALEYDNDGLSYVGNDGDYIRWAKEVSGIGDCIVVPAFNGPGTVKLILVDANGTPANEKLQQEVFDHIVSPGDRSKRLLPTACAELTVEAATTKSISYVCTGLVVQDGFSLEQIKEAFCREVLSVYAKTKKEGVLRYNQVRPLLSAIPGVVDFEEFTMNGAAENIILLKGEYAVTDRVDFSEAGTEGGGVDESGAVSQ